MTRSRIEAFDQTAQALADLADRLRSATPVLQQAVDDYVDQMGAPNGTEWEGDTAASYFATATSDRLSSVAPAITHANELADISARGSDYLLGAREAALEAISQAEADEFTVGEDLSVSDNYAWESREQQAAARLPRWPIATTSRTWRPGWKPRTRASPGNSMRAPRR
ncbi:hypothetical protein I552_4312 [Mycobacterium xenopi 3993]|nr:hypothetical protein I552_4312 [Mycobacterium xenopi 3993]